jgi:hypothetical protein
MHGPGQRKRLRRGAQRVAVRPNSVAKYLGEGTSQGEVREIWLPFSLWEESRARLRGYGVVELVDRRTDAGWLRFGLDQRLCD